MGMKRKSFLTLMVLVAVVGLSSNALSEETKEGSILFNETAKLQENVSAGATTFSLPLVPHGNLKVPINISQNSSKTIWNTTNPRAAFVFAGITNTGNLSMDVITISPDQSINQYPTPPRFAGKVAPFDGIIVYGRYLAIKVKIAPGAPNTFGTGTLETLNWPPGQI